MLMFIMFIKISREKLKKPFQDFVAFSNKPAALPFLISLFSFLWYSFNTSSKQLTVKWRQLILTRINMLRWQEERAETCAKSNCILMWYFAICNICCKVKQYFENRSPKEGRKEGRVQILHLDIFSYSNCAALE
jgi:hypothetical protein